MAFLQSFENILTCLHDAISARSSQRTQMHPIHSIGESHLLLRMKYEEGSSQASPTVETSHVFMELWVYDIGARGVKSVKIAKSALGIRVVALHIVVVRILGLRACQANGLRGQQRCAIVPSQLAPRCQETCQFAERSSISLNCR